MEEIIKKCSEFFIQLAPSLGISTIILSLINYYLDRRKNPNEYEIKKMKLYEDMFFNGIKNGIGEKLDLEQSAQYFNSLIKEMIGNPKNSIYLSDETKKAMRSWKNSGLKIDSLMQRIEMEYAQLRYRFHYKNRIFNSTLANGLALSIFTLSFCTDLSAIVILLLNLLNFSQVEYNNIWIFLLGSYSVLITFISGKFIYDNMFIYSKFYRWYKKTVEKIKEKKK